MIFDFGKYTTMQITTFNGDLKLSDHYVAWKGLQGSDGAHKLVRDRTFLEKEKKMHAYHVRLRAFLLLSISLRSFLLGSCACTIVAIGLIIMGSIHLYRSHIHT